MNSQIVADITVIGGGLAGLTQTLLLAQADIPTVCIEPNPMPTDERTTAISYGSMKLLERAAIWDDLKPFACPIHDIQILDANSPVLLDFNAQDISDQTDGSNSFGWIIENKYLRKTLIDHLTTYSTANIKTGTMVNGFEKQDKTIIVSLDNTQTIETKLVIGADGRQSFTREHMQVGEYQWSYKQNALVCIFEHTQSHNNIAVEHFLPQGPFAVLPMLKSKNGKHRSALVWTQDTSNKASLDKYSDSTFKIALNEQLPSFYGEVQHVSPRKKYPLGLIHAYHYTKERFALIADAAHGIHPIAGQGLNLGLRDVACLTDIIINAKQNKKDIGSIDVLQTYETKRKADNKAMIVTTDILNRIFSNQSKTIRLMRKIGMRAIDRFAPSKKFLMSQAAGIKKN